jgi:hypothetical protein
VSATNEMEVFHLIGRPVQAAERSAPTIEDCYRNLVAAIFLQAKKDLRDPGYRSARRSGCARKGSASLCGDAGHRAGCSGDAAARAQWAMTLVLLGTSVVLTALVWRRCTWRAGAVRLP